MIKEFFKSILVIPILLILWPFPNWKLGDRIGSALIDWVER